MYVCRVGGRGGATGTLEHEHAQLSGEQQKSRPRPSSSPANSTGSSSGSAPRWKPRPSKGADRLWGRSLGTMNGSSSGSWAGVRNPWARGNSGPCPFLFAFNKIEDVIYWEEMMSRRGEVRVRINVELEKEEECV